MQYRHLHMGVKTGNDAAIFCKNLVNFSAVTSDIMFVICVPSYGYWAKIRRRSHSSRLDFQPHYTVEMSTGAFKVAMNVYISYKFSGLLSSSSVVNAAQLCTAGINQNWG